MRSWILCWLSKEDCLAAGGPQRSRCHPGRRTAEPSTTAASRTLAPVQRIEEEERLVLCSRTGAGSIQPIDVPQINHRPQLWQEANNPELHGGVGGSWAGRNRVSMYLPPSPTPRDFLDLPSPTWQLHFGANSLLAQLPGDVQGGDRRRWSGI